MKQYSVDLRERLLGAIDAGLSQAEAARLFGVGTATIARWRRRQREHGSVAPPPRPGRPRRIGRARNGRLLAQVRAQPDATLARALRAVGSRAGRAPQRSDDVAGAGAAGLAAQKKSLQASERDETARAAWWAEVAALDPSRLVFVDESGTHTAMTRLRARAPARRAGRRPRAAQPRPQRHALCRLDTAGDGSGLGGGGRRRLAACETYVRQLLAPSLRPGQVVIMDQLNVHKGATIRTLIEGAGCELRCCRPTPRTSIPSSKPSPRSRPTCAPLRRAPSPPW